MAEENKNDSMEETSEGEILSMLLLKKILRPADNLKE